MPKFDAFGWGELISLIAVVISFATISISLSSRSKTETQNEQKMFDKLDRLNDVTRETNETVKQMSAKIDDHTERLAHLESDRDTIYKRIERIEKTQDNCQACRTSKQVLYGNQA